MASPHVGDIGTTITITVRDHNYDAIDISGASSKTWTVKKPNGSTVTWTPDFVTTGADGMLDYTTIAGDLDMAGVWLIQVNITTASWTAKSDPAKFHVEANL